MTTRGPSEADERCAKAICSRRNEGCQCLDRPLCCNGEAIGQARAAIAALIALGWRAPEEG